MLERSGSQAMTCPSFRGTRADRLARRSLQRGTWLKQAKGDGWKLVAGSDCVEVFAGGDGRKIVLFAQAAIDVAGDASSERSLDVGAVATNQNGKRDFGIGLVGVSQNPANGGKLIGAGAGFSAGKLASTGIEVAVACTVVIVAAAP